MDDRDLVRFAERLADVFVDPVPGHPNIARRRLTIEQGKELAQIVADIARQTETKSS